MNGYCLIHVQPDGVPQLRDLSVDDAADLPEALAAIVDEWREVNRVEVFVDDRLQFVLDADDVKKLREGGWPGM